MKDNPPVVTGAPPLADLAVRAVAYLLTRPAGTVVTWAELAAACDARPDAVQHAAARLLADTQTGGAR